MAVLGACQFLPPSMRFYQASEAAAPGPQVLRFVPNATGPATATPFQPATRTPTPIPPTLTPTPTITLSPTITPTKKPTRTPTKEKIPDVDPLRERMNVVLLGSDSRGGTGYRTDVILFVSVNPDTKSVSIISFPRDLWVMLPGYGYQRINTAMEYGGFSMLKSTLETNFGLRPDHYALVDFDGFIKLIDTLDGIAVNVAKKISDSCDLPEGSYGICTVGPGKVVMDGELALWYVRSRHTSNDLDRNRRQQEVAMAVFHRLISQHALTRSAKIYELFKDNVETDLSLNDLMPLIPIALSVYKNPDHINRFNVDSTMVSDYIAPGGAWVLLPNLPAIQNMIYDAMSR